MEEPKEEKENKELNDNPEHKAAYLVSFILRRSLSSPPVAPLTKLGYLCVRTLWMSERSALTRLVQLESLVADRYGEEKRGLRALAREQRRLEREKRRLEEKKDALRTYRRVLNTPAEYRSYNDDDEEVEEEDDEDDDDDEEEEDEEDLEQDYEGNQFSNALPPPI